VDVLSFLLEHDPEEIAIDSPRACFDMLESLDATLATSARSIDRAAAGGFRADRLGYAFLAGYRAALMRLDPSLKRTSLCATEEGGAHPRAIQTRLVAHEGAFRLTGKKTFATLASEATALLVVASVFTEDGARNHLRVVRVPVTRNGLVIRDRPPLPFAPEIPHAQVVCDDVRVESPELLDGDGYADVLKPFRTFEDMHVTVAWLAYVVRLVRKHAGPHRLAEEALAAIAALGALSERDPLAPTTHVALAGVLTQAAALVHEWDLTECDETTRSRWQRDIPLLEVATTVRNLRLEAGWAKLGHPERKREHATESPRKLPG